MVGCKLYITTMGHLLLSILVLFYFCNSMSIGAILLQLDASGYSIRGVLEALLTNLAYQSHPALHDLVEDVPDILSLLLQQRIEPSPRLLHFFILFPLLVS